MLALAAVTVGTIPAHADTTYDVTFNDTSSAAFFNNGSGIFTVNGADAMNRFDATFTVKKAFSWYGQYNVGDSFTLDTSSNAYTYPYKNDLPDYNATTGIFSANITLYDNTTSGENGLRLSVGDTGAYDVYPLGDGEFWGQYGDSGTFTSKVSLSPTNSPEPATAGLLLASFSAIGLGVLRKRLAPSK